MGLVAPMIGSPLAGRLGPLGAAPHRFVPSDLTGLIAWWDAGILGLADGASVSSWADRAGVQANATSPSGKRPLYKANILNSLPVVRFSSVTAGDYLTWVSSSLLVTSRTAFLVASPTLPSALVRPWLSNATGNWYFSVTGDATTGSMHGSYANASNAQVTYASSAGTVASATTAVFCWQISTAGSNVTRSLYKNGTLLSSVTLATGHATPTATTWYLGNFTTSTANPFVGDVAEAIVYDLALIDVDRQRVERYLGNKYNVTVA